MVVKEEQKNDNPRDDEINSLVSSLLKPIFSIIYKIIPPQIKLSRYIWYIITILFLLLGLQYQFLNLKTTIIIFVSILVLEIASLNIDIIKSLFKNKNKDRIQTFLTDINNKDLGAIINFLDNNNLETNDLKILLETKYKNNIDLHKKIIKTQDYNCDFIDFLINKKIINSIPPHLISRYILWCPTSLNDVSLHYLSQIDSIKIKGSLALTHPILVKSTNIMHRLFRPILSFCCWTSELIRKKQSRVFLLFLLTLIFMFLYRFEVTKQLVKKEGITEIIESLMGSFVGSIFLSGMLILFGSWLYFKITIPLLGFIYRSSSIKK